MARRTSSDRQGVRTSLMQVQISTGLPRHLTMVAFATVARCMWIYEYVIDHQVGSLARGCFHRSPNRVTRWSLFRTATGGCFYAAAILEAACMFHGVATVPYRRRRNLYPLSVSCLPSYLCHFMPLEPRTEPPGPPPYLLIDWAQIIWSSFREIHIFLVYWFRQSAMDQT
jgi:hypothetical protein